MTTKIQFKLSNDILLTVIQMVEKTDDYVVQSIKDALLVSIKEDLLAKLEEKAKNIQKQISILDHNKKHAIVLKYHEAYTMYKLLELVYEKETFADHAHIKKIKRLLLDLENKVESFTTENKETDSTETALPDRPSFPSLGVNEIIIEEATILEGECNENDQTMVEDEHHPVLDPTIDINEIFVKNYSIFDILEETDPTNLPIDEENSLAIEVTETDVLPADSIEETQTIITEETLEIHEENQLTEEKLTVQENSTSEEPRVEDSTALTAIEAATVTATETTQTKQEETLSTTWAKQAENPVFDGVVTKTSICIESEDLSAISSTETTPEEDTLPIFEEPVLPTQIQEDKVEKESKKEKKKPSKDNTQQGQISLF